jgi:dTDP-4-dehydrorhamnose reductase
MKMENPSCKKKIEIWGGIECTINRVNDTYYDQLELSGHYHRKDDIDLFASLGVKAFRYPVLWERHHSKTEFESWQPIEENLLKLKFHGITPIAGLVHHGSGPSHVNMLENSFVSGLESYAALVARKFPWLEYYTPVNEPLTTARFCGLYGHWHPHAKEDLLFYKIFLNECKATVLAMKAIRTINAEAKLIQTEDLGKVYSTPLLQYQADFENERRWLTYDLLCGKLTKNSRMWDHMRWLGIEEKELTFFEENPCPPYILGVNHYVTSERFIDENIARYPQHTHGGNGRHVYADVEAVRVNLQEPYGPEVLIKELWNRFALPIAVTEVQLSCTREEQLRWLKELWNAANKLLDAGVDIRAITPWSFLGAFGWNHLLTKDIHDYELGVFDIRSQNPRPTALTKMIKSLSSGNDYQHPFLESDGWWRHQKRLLYFPFAEKNEIDNPIEINKGFALKNIRPVIITGKNGTLGQAFARACEERDIYYILMDRADLDICNPKMIQDVLSKYKPWAIINAAGYVRVDDAETDSEKCFLDNMEGPTILAKFCHCSDVKLLTFSSDLVFDGKKRKPYLESDSPSPLNIYGLSKAEAEASILSVNPDALIIRTSAFFGPWDNYNFVTITLNALSQNKQISVANDSLISPTYIPDLTHASLDLLMDEAKGIWHLANDGAVSWSDFAAQIADHANLDKSLINIIPLQELKYKATRPSYSVLKSEKGIFLPSLDSAIDRFFSHRTTSFCMDRKD